MNVPPDNPAAHPPQQSGAYSSTSDFLIFETHTASLENILGVLSSSCRNAIYVHTHVPQPISTVDPAPAPFPNRWGTRSQLVLGQDVSRRPREQPLVEFRPQGRPAGRVEIHGQRSIPHSLSGVFSLVYTSLQQSSCRETTSYERCGWSWFFATAFSTSVASACGVLALLTDAGFSIIAGGSEYMCDTQQQQCRMRVLLVFHQSSYAAAAAAAAAPNTDGRGTEKTPRARSTKAGQGPRKYRSRGTEARPPFYSWWGTSCSRLTAATLPVSSCGSGCVTWEHTYGIARQRLPRPRTPPSTSNPDAAPCVFIPFVQGFW